MAASDARPVMVMSITMAIAVLGQGQGMRARWLWLAVALLSLSASADELIFGNVRVQTLSANLVRVESKGTPCV